MTSAFGFVGQDSQKFRMAFWLLLKALMEPVFAEICIIESSSSGNTMAHIGKMLETTRATTLPGAGGASDLPSSVCWLAPERSIPSVKHPRAAVGAREILYCICTLYTLVFFA